MSEREFTHVTTVPDGYTDVKLWTGSGAVIPIAIASDKPPVMFMDGEWQELKVAETSETIWPEMIELEIKTMFPKLSDCDCQMIAYEAKGSLTKGLREARSVWLKMQEISDQAAEFAEAEDYQ